MSRTVDSNGPIETFCQRAEGPVSRGSAYSFDQILVGDRVALCFAAEDTKSPYSLRVKAPNGALVIERLLRELPTGLPQSEPPVTFVVSSAGNYQVEIRELTGKSWGQATIRVG